jgi:hypothetical protein
MHTVLSTPGIDNVFMIWLGIQAGSAGGGSWGQVGGLGGRWGQMGGLGGRWGVLGAAPLKFVWGYFVLYGMA